MGEKLVDFLAKFDYWQLLVAFLLFTLYSIIARPSFKWKNLQINLFTKRNGYSAFQAWKSHMEKKIYFLEYLGITKAQMKRVDGSLLKIKEALMSNYAKLLREVDPDTEVTATRDYMDYGAHVEVMLRLELRDKVRELILDQDILIPEITSRDFEDFCRNTAKVWYDEGRSYMDLWYVSSGRAISREQLRSSVVGMMPLFERETREILRDIKIVEVDFNKKIEGYKEQIRAREKVVLGEPLT